MNNALLLRRRHTGTSSCAPAYNELRECLSVRCRLGGLLPSLQHRVEAGAVRGRSAAHTHINSREGRVKRWNRKWHRLRCHDYAASAVYFLTMCCEAGYPFGWIRNGKMHLSAFGEIVREEWEKTPLIRPQVRLDAFQIMPDHFHAIVIFENIGPPSSDASLRDHHGVQYRKPWSLGSTIAGFKGVTTARINRLRNTPGQRVWQRNYWDRIIYSERAIRMVRRYIRNNPARWGKRRR